MNREKRWKKAPLWIRFQFWIGFPPSKGFEAWANKDIVEEYLWSRSETVIDLMERYCQGYLEESVVGNLWNEETKAEARAEIERIKEVRRCLKWIKEREGDK